MFRRLTALLLIGLLSMACALPALAETDDIAIEGDIELAEGQELPESDIPEISGLELPELSVEEPAAGIVANAPDEGEDQPIELSVKKSATKEATVGLSYQIVVPGKTIKSCKSSNKKIATVTKKGLVKTKKAGTVKITITPKKGKKLVLKLKVTESEPSGKHYMISHAMGGIDGYNYSNCLEGFLENYQEGHRIFEVDMEYTSDGQMVLWHDWGQRFCSEYKKGRTPTYDEFMGSRIFDKYTPMDVERLLRLMDEYPDVRIITDTKYTKTATVKKQFKTIVSTAGDLGIPDVLDRLIVEIYSREMFKAVEDVHHFKEYMFTLYKAYKKAPSKSQLKSVAKFCEQNGIATVAMYAKWWKPKYADIIEPYGLDIALYTVNSKREARKFFDEGVTALFTDFLPPV